LSHRRVLPIAGELCRCSTSQIEPGFLEGPVLLFGVMDGSFSRMGAAEHRYLDLAVIVGPLNPPLAREHLILKDHGWLSYAFAVCGSAVLPGAAKAHAGLPC